jgi:hypothetical protein
MLFSNDGQQLGLREIVSHWNMGRRLLDRVRSVDTKNGLKTVPNPAGDEDVRRWYVVGCAYMTRVKNIEPAHLTRALELFPNDPDVLFFAASAHETFAGVRTQAVMRSMTVPRGVSFDVEDEDAELRRAEQLYKRANRAKSEPPRGQNSSWPRARVAWTAQGSGRFAATRTGRD